MKKIGIVITILILSVSVFAQDQIGFEFGCVSSKWANENNPTGKFGAVFTNQLLYVVIGVNAPHERHPIYDEVQNRIHAGVYTKIGATYPFFDRLSIYPYLAYSTKYYNIAKNSLLYKNESYLGIAVKYTDIAFGAGLVASLDRRNITLGIVFNLD